jgi:hypothetical protein
VLALAIELNNKFADGVSTRNRYRFSTAGWFAFDKKLHCARGSAAKERSDT